jgi:hypothetical protein
VEYAFSKKMAIRNLAITHPLFEEIPYHEINGQNEQFAGETSITVYTTPRS